MISIISIMFGIAYLDKPIPPSECERLGYVQVLYTDGETIRFLQSMALDEFTAEGWSCNLDSGLQCNTQDAGENISLFTREYCRTNGPNEYAILYITIQNGQGGAAAPSRVKYFRIGEET